MRSAERSPGSDRPACGGDADPLTERRLDWDGCANVRDLGGHPTRSGDRTAFQAVVRADSIRQLSERGWEALVEYGVRTVVDLRSPYELEIDPPRDLPVELVHVPLLHAEDDETKAALDSWATTEEAYLWILERFRLNFVQAVRAIAHAPEGAVLVHCMGGKDRTGLVVALLLTLVGVPPEEIAEDYGLSARNLASLSARWIDDAADEDAREWRRRVVRGEPQAMLEVLRQLEARYGSVEAYLVAGGATEAELDRARARLLEGG